MVGGLVVQLALGARGRRRSQGRRRVRLASGCPGKSRMLWRFQRSRMSKKLRFRCGPFGNFG